MKSRMLWNTGSPAFAGDDGAGRCHPHHAKGRKVPGWVEHAVFWQIYPLGFTGAEADARDRAGVVHRLGHIKSWLDYAVELGASGLLLGPIFASSTHGYETFEGHRQLVALNHDEPAVAHYVARVMNHWLERGADGWRLDAAYAVPRQFWAQVLPQVRTEHPDAYVF